MSGFECIKGPVFAGSDEEGRVNAGFIRTARGALAVDSLVSPEGGRALAAAARAEAGGISAVVFTHEHWDHIAGSAEFPPGGVIASEGTAGGLAAELEWAQGIPELANASPRRPSLVFETRVRLPWEPEVVVVELGGHAEGSSVVFVPEYKVLFAGDLVFNGRPAWVGGIRPEKWLFALRLLEGWDIDVVVPGHGPVGGKDVLATQRVWLERFLAEASALRERGEGLQRAAAALAADFGFAGRQLDSLKAALVHRLGFTTEEGGDRP